MDTYSAGNFGATLRVHISICAIKGLNIIVVHKAPEVLESLSHFMVIWKTKNKTNERLDTKIIIAHIVEKYVWIKVLK